MPEWRSWQTRETQNLVRVTLSVGSIPSSGTSTFLRFANGPQEYYSSRMPGKPPEPKATPFHNPFAALGSLRQTLATPPAAKNDAASAPEPPAAPAAPGGETTAVTGKIPRAVIRMERAGRGGKEVTVVDHLEVSDKAEWLKALKSALGCGGVVEDGRIVLQGDHRKRLPALLTARGVRKVTVG